VARPGQAWILDRPVLPPVCARTSHRWPSVRMYTSRRPRELRFPFHQCRSVLTRRTYSAGRREEILTARDRAWPSSPRHPPNTHHHTAAVRRSPGRLSSVGGRGRRRVVVGHVLQPGVALAAQRPPRPAHRHLRPRQQSAAGLWPNAVPDARWPGGRRAARRHRPDLWPGTLIRATGYGDSHTRFR